MQEIMEVKIITHTVNKFMMLTMNVSDMEKAKSF